MNEQHTDNDLPAATSGYFAIFFVIAALIFVAIGVSFLNLGANAIFFNLLIAAVQASLLGYYFMHLKEAERLTWLVVGSGLFWLGIMFVLLLTDYVTRYMRAY